MSGVKVTTANLNFDKTYTYAPTYSDSYTLRGFYNSGLPSDISIDKIIAVQDLSNIPIDTTSYHGSGAWFIMFTYVSVYTYSEGTSTEYNMRRFNLRGLERWSSGIPQFEVPTYGMTSIPCRIWYI